MPLEAQKPQVDITSSPTTPVTIADGADVAQGAQADAAVTTDAAGSQAGKLRGIVKMLASAWDSVNNRFRVGVHDDGNSISVDDGGGVLSTDSADGAHATLGATSDADTANTVIGRLKKIVALLGGGLPTALSGSGNLKVAVLEGGGGASQADKSGFTEGTSAFTPVGGVYNETPASDPTEDQAAAVRITQKRAAHVNLRDAAGTEIGTTSNPVRVDPTGTTSQPVTLQVGDNRAGRVKLDFRNSSGGRRYQITLQATASAGSVNVASILNPAGESSLHIYKVRVIFRTAGGAASGVPLLIFRGSSISNGTAKTAANIPKLNTSVANAAASIRTNLGSNITATLGAEPILALGGLITLGAATTGTLYEWKAIDCEDQIILAANEGLVFQTDGGPDANTVYTITIAWEETT